MRVLIFTSQFVCGAAERLGVELAVDLNRKGVHADILSLYSNEFEGAAEAKESLLKRGVPQCLFLNLTTNPSFLSVIVAIFTFAKLIKLNGYTIVETSSITPAIIASLAGWSVKFKHISGIHFVYSRKSYFDIRHLLLKYCTKLSPQVYHYAVSEYAKLAWSRYAKVNKDRISTIYNSLNEIPAQEIIEAESLYAELGIQESSKIILCVGRIAKYKRVDFAIESLLPLLEQQDVHIVFIGVIDYSVRGTRDMMEKIKNIYLSSKIKNRIHFTGFRTDVCNYMQTADLLVHCSEKESFGLVLIEALSHGLPIVAVGAEAIPEILNGSGATIVALNDSKAFRESVSEVLQRDENYQLYFRDLGLRHARKFTQSERTKGMLELFNRN